MNLGLERRIAKLEEQHGGGEREFPQVAQLILSRGESEGAARAKYRAEHPELDGKEIQWVVINIISPDPDGSWPCRI